MIFKLNEAKMFADIADGFAVIINSETGVYYGMNPFTSSIFDNIVRSVPTECIIEDVLSIEGAPADFATRLEELVKGLQEKEIILPVLQGLSSSSVDRKYAIEDHFEISWNEFQDAKELLLADPIHAVREEEGWTPEVTSLNPDLEDVARRESKMNSDKK